MNESQDLCNNNIILPADVCVDNRVNDSVGDFVPQSALFAGSYERSQGELSDNNTAPGGIASDDSFDDFDFDYDYDYFASSCARDFTSDTLKRHVGRWKKSGLEEIFIPDELVQTVIHGANIPWKNLPTRVHLQNPPMNSSQREFARAKLRAYIRQLVCSRSSKVPWCVLPVFCVPKKGSNDEWRLVFNGVHINGFVFKRTYTNDSIYYTLRRIKRGMFGFTIDLRSAYFHCRIRRRDRKYFGFCFEGQYYVFNAMPFGFTLSGYYLYTLLRPLTDSWKAAGIIFSLFVDDLAFFADSYDEACALRAKVIRQFMEFGFVINEKCG